MRIGFFIVMFLAFGCVKDEGNITKPNFGSGETSGSSGGSTTGNASTGTEDPLATYAWHLENRGQSSFSGSGGKAGEDIKVKTVHSSLNIKGKNVRIAVSDTGVDIDHADLSGNTLSTEHRNYVFTQPSRWAGASPYPSDGEAHGTATSGLIAAIGWNGIGSRGIAPSAKFAGFRYIFEYSSSETDASMLARELDQMSGSFDVFNYSYGYSGTDFINVDPKIFTQLEYGATTQRSGKGSIYVQSAGNSYTDYYDLCSGPAISCEMKVSGNSNSSEDQASPHKILVGAVNALGLSSSYSTPGSGLWVSAPGGEFGIDEPAMITTDIAGCSSGDSYRNYNYSYFNFGSHALNPYCDYTSLFNGTSSAAPVVSGVVALMLEANPNLNWREIKHILALTSDPIDYDPLNNSIAHPWGFNLLNYVYDYKWTRNAAGFYFSNWYGFGRVNALRAVQTAQAFATNSLGTYEKTLNTVPNPDQWYYDSGAINLAIPDEDANGVEDRIWVGHNFLIEAIQIQITTNHTWPGDLAVHLVSPSGTESRLLNTNSNIYSLGLNANTLLLSNAFYGERSLGYWRIKIVDGSSAITTKDDGTITGTGSLLNWKILVHGHQSSSDLLKPYPVTMLSMPSGSTSATTSPVFSFADTISKSNLNRYEVAVGTTPGGSDTKAWYSIGTANTTLQVTGLTLEDAKTYYLSVRAVSNQGYSSTVQVKSWVPDY
ncbi:S8 family serine peptidase [Peredibacter starrii]|uniref:S8 family serine peptidase n=1 Tax=Peredibacter starrii TaxID=28202 RepID=A0AAX4HLY3_9BACT|nr:S8 family serine peptidase [Peredibacter starrii]WPU64172.1 S8 family serine peptidase [Peredibacter starrii]